MIGLVSKELDADEKEGVHHLTEAT
jgi:hypothetical protein